MAALRTLLLRLWVGAICAALITPAATAQELGVTRTAILTIESDRLYSDSDFGRRVAQEIEAEGAVLAAENARIQAELTEEESDLTQQRAGLDPKAFRALADQFDEKVQDIRRTQEGKARALTQKQDASRALFFTAAQPILENLMREAGASVILERANVFLSANVSDITSLAIARINATLGDGVDLLAPENEN